MKHPITIAIEMMGSQKALADKLDVVPSNISQWISGYRKIPVDRCNAIEALTNGRVTRESLRPDVYGASPASTA